MKGYQQYFDGVGAVLEKIRGTQGEKIEEAAKLVAKAVADDSLIYVYGAGHSNLIAEEVFYRAGSLVPVSHIVDISLSGTVGVTKSEFMERLEGVGPVLYNHTRPEPGSVFIVISNSGRNAAPIEVAREAQKHGHPVIAITSVTYSTEQSSRHSSGKKLLDYADVVLDNCGAFGDVCVEIPDMERPVGPTSGVAGAFLIHAVMVQAIFNLVEMGVEPPVFISGNRDDGRKLNQGLLDRYWSRIRNW